MRVYGSNTNGGGIEKGTNTELLIVAALGEDYNILQEMCSAVIEKYRDTTYSKGCTVWGSVRFCKQLSHMMQLATPTVPRFLQSD